MKTSTNTNTNTNDGGARVVVIAIGAAVALLALVALGSGAALVGTHATQRDDDGFYASGVHRIATPTRAFVSDKLEIGSDAPDWLFSKGRLGTIRVTATGTAARPVFVGIARQARVDAYLRGVGHDEITDLELDPFSLETVRHTGAAKPARPFARTFWSRSATGAGTQTVAWRVQKGNWAVVVMNADGSPGVVTELGVGAKLGLLLWIGIGLLIGGLIAAAAAVAMLVVGARMRPAAPAHAKVPHEALGGVVR